MAPKDGGRAAASRRRILLSLVGLTLIFGAVQVFDQEGGSGTANPGYNGIPNAVAPEVPTTPWVPVGFTKASMDETIAYRWMDGAEYDCEILDRCWGMELVSKDGCPGGMYVELTTLAADGAAVGFTNDTVGSIVAGGKARMVFDNTDDSASKARLADVSCR